MKIDSIQADILTANEVNVAKGEQEPGDLECRHTRHPGSCSPLLPAALVHYGDSSSNLSVVVDPDDENQMTYITHFTEAQKDEDPESKE